MLLCHFSYLSGHSEGLLQPHHFGFKHIQNRPKERAPRRKHAAAARRLELSSAISKGIVAIKEATGHSFGKDALHLTLALAKGPPPGSGHVEVVVLAGTIFQHIDWVHKQVSERRDDEKIVSHRLTDWCSLNNWLAVS